MKTYPNQKVITINKAKADRENTYATINKECLMKAITELTHNELKIYLYLASNQNGFQLALSSADIADKTNASKRKIQESINSLIEKGYLVETGSNSYDFIEDTMYKKYTGDVHEKDTGICTKSTQECVQKVHSNVYKKDTEILHYNTLYNTSSIIQAEENKTHPNNPNNLSVSVSVSDSDSVSDSVSDSAAIALEQEKKEEESQKEDKALKNTSTDITTPTSTSTTTTVNVNVNAHDSQEEEKTEPKKEDTFINFLKGLTCTQLQEIKDMYAEGIQYQQIASTYKIKYFDGKKFAEHYDEIYKERYEMEHPEEVERRQQQERELRELDYEKRKEEAETFKHIEQMMKNNRKPAQDNNKPKPSTANKMTMIDGSAIDSRLTGQSFPESILDNIKNGIITVDELVEMQLADMAYNSSADNAISWE